MPALVPELAVTDLVASLAFWRDTLGFAVAYARPEEGFAYLKRGGAAVMLDQIGLGRDFDGGHLPRERPFGRGVNLQIGIPALAPLVRALEDAAWPLFLPPETRVYRTDRGPVAQRQFVVADPDGYLLRFFEDTDTA
jgi:catechol 2,3-dioxygenase-like lactoylglutathione lyase family enzyme